MKKIPPGSEASNVLVGEVDFLQHSIIAFVRLENGQLLGDLTEVPIPTRFLFILLGPKGRCGRYHEIGRSIATLMSDEVCVCLSALFGFCVCLSVCLSVCLCVFLSACLPVCVCLSVCLSACLCVFVCLPVCLFVCVCVFL